MKGRKPELVVDNDAIEETAAPPDWLSEDAQAEWRRVMPVLIERRVLTEADMACLEAFCIATGRVRQLERLLRDDFDPKLFRAQDKAMTTARQLAAELGLTPVSRSRPTMRKEAADDDDTNPLLFDFMDSRRLPH